ncbi:hypothetical protein ACWF82_31600 [Nocardia sp. NPDC055053]
MDIHDQCPAQPHPCACFILRDWQECDVSVHTTVLGWARHPDVPEHAGIGLIAGTIGRSLYAPPGDNDRVSPHFWVLFAKVVPVALISADIRPQWHDPDEFVPVSPPVPIHGPVMSHATLVDPGRWGRGYSTTAKVLAAQHPVAQGVRTCHVEIRADNDRSIRALSKIPAATRVGTSIEVGHQWIHFAWPRLSDSQAVAPT